MRFYFHLGNGSEVIRDDEGVEAASVEDARTEARLAIEEVVREGGTGILDWSGWRLEVSDAAGVQVFSVPLDSLP